MCKSQFGTTDRLVVQQGMEFFRLEGQFQKEDKSYKVVAKVIPRQRKEIELNGVIHPKLADHIGLFPVVMITPYDIDLGMEGSEIRRRFLDNSLAQIDATYLTALLSYNRILRQRNAALKSFPPYQANHTLLDSLDEQLVTPGTLIHQKRAAFVKELIPIFTAYYQEIASGQEVVDSLYKSTLLELPLSQSLKENREKDILLQRSTVGIHKDDLQFLIKGYPLKKFASQGQLKSFILALKLAQYEIVKNNSRSLPLLLLDDIFDKLDQQRVQQLIQLLFRKEFGQIFFTDTQKDRLVKIIEPFGVEICQLEIADGAVSELC